MTERRLRVLMLVQSAVAGDSRVLREAHALAGAGHEVHVVGRAVPAGFVPPAGVTVASVGRAAGLRPAGAPGSRGRGGLRPLVTAARWLLLPEHRARVEAAWRRNAAALVDAWRAGGPPDVVHAHDFNTLELAADVADRTGAALVYDTHEWWSGRLRPGRPTPWADRRQRARERALGARADLVVTVSKPIARRLRAWGWPRVVVVRNTFPGPPRTPEQRARPGGVLYAGRIGAGRDLPAVIAAAARVPDLTWTLMGSVDDAFLAGHPLPPDVRLEPPADVDDVDAPLRRAGLSLVTLEDTCENHRLALPNKLFHAVRAGVPVVAADLSAIAEVVHRHGIGVLYTPGNAASLAAAVRDAVTRYPELLAAVAAAQATGELSWEVDARALLEAYPAPARAPVTPRSGR
jgi:glycosyltransferase involved in cell wall biosynthesis